MSKSNSPASEYAAVNRNARVRRGRSAANALLLCFEDIAGAANCVYQLHGKRVIYFASQPAHIYVHHVGVAVEVYVPNRFGDQRTRKHFAGAASQQGEEEKLLCRKFDSLARSS